jgi:hypothetical protein
MAHLLITSDNRGVTGVRKTPYKYAVLFSRARPATAKQRQIYDIQGMCPPRISYYTKRGRSGGERKVMTRVMRCYGREHRGAGLSGWR